MNKKRRHKRHYIALRNYKVLLVQLVKELMDRLLDSGLAPGSKRLALTEQVIGSLLDLERELKRDTDLKSSRLAKRDLYLALYDEGRVPPWLLETLFKALTEETHQLSSRSAS